MTPIPRRVRHEETGATGTMMITDEADGRVTVRTVLDEGGEVTDTMTREVFEGLWDEWEVVKH